MVAFRRFANWLRTRICGEVPPPGWGTDALTDFLNTARHNAFATYANRRGPFLRLNHIDEIYRALHAKMDDNPAWFVLLFFLKAHSAYLAAIQLAANTQVSETYPLLRSVLENALYGLRIHDDPQLAPVWLKRHDGSEALRAVKSAFKIGDLLNLLDKKDAVLGKTVRTLYERTIDLGAHPNEQALTSSLKISESEESVSFDVVYLTADDRANLACLRSVAQVGVAGLQILRLIVPGYYTTEVEAAMARVAKGL